MRDIFNDLTMSEKIRLLSEKYNKAGGGDAHRCARARERIGLEYGMTGRNIARYIRCDRLISSFRKMLDDRSLTLIAAVEISFLSDEEQSIVAEVMEQNCIKLDRDSASRLRSAAGSITKDLVQAMFGLDKPVMGSEGSVNVKIPAKIYSRYFANVAAKDVQGIVEEALGLYFEGKET